MVVMCGIAGIFNIVLNYCVNIRDNRRARLLEPMARQALERVYYQLIDAIKNKYPKVCFPAHPLSQYIRTLDQHNYKLKQETLGFSAILLEPLIASVINSYLQTSDRFDVPSVSSRSIGTHEFWNNEHLHRKTPSGADPKDWHDRRKIIHDRDGGRCIRCGVAVELGDCHIHHLLRRSSGGDHSIQNLVTLCRSCHTTMDGHASMRAIHQYIVTNRGVIHITRCRSAGNGRRVWDSVPRLRSKGYVACRKCNPWNKHSMAMESWTPEIDKFVRATAQSLIEQVHT